MKKIIQFLLLLPLTAIAHANLEYVADQPLSIRYNSQGILELRAELPKGTKISVSDSYQLVFLDYRQPDGKIGRSSTGFVTPLAIVAVPDPVHFPQAVIDDINATRGGLFVSATVVAELLGGEGEFPQLVAGPAGEGFTKNYEDSGRPKFSYTKQITKRFGASLNHAIDPNTQPPLERAKWLSIFLELQRAADRTTKTPKFLFMIEKALADQRSVEFETNGTVPTNGAWTIAVLSTAVRHGFPNVPCAEFMSELIREAYQRAGIAVTDDFNATKQNILIWSETAAVTRLARALHRAGWVPWDTVFFRPPTGAILMNGAGDTPGHAYISAGDDGRFVVDNGSPQGRDLRVTSKKIIEMMYQTGLFFLPPGINPLPW